jgi:uncharacterized delta-60 repeat protein/gliding motility-associated-like protein
MRKSILFLKCLFTSIIYLNIQLTFAQSGMLDPSFTIGTGANTLNTSTIQTDGKILIGGFLTMYNNVQVIGIARLNTDGTLDNTFNSGTGPSGGVNSGGAGREAAIIQLANGEILIGGNFTTYNGIPRNNIALLNADGSLDVNFDPGQGFNDEVYSMEVQADGKILVGGKFTQANGVDRHYIARLNPDGSLDQSFDIGNKITTAIGFNGIYSTITLSNGDILLAGAFRSDVGNSPKNGIFKVHADGSLDVDFNTTGIGSNSTIFNVMPLANGKIIIFGSFSSYNGIARNRIARLNADGTLDQSFDPGVGVDGVGHYGFVVSTSACLQPDGKIIMVGDFSTYEGQPYNGIVRINPDGSLDTSFNPGLGANDLVWSVSLQTDSKIVITGNFTSFNGTSMNSLARLKNCYNTFNTLNITSCNNYSLNSTTYNKTGTYTQKIIKPSGCDSIITLNLTIDTKPDSSVLITGVYLHSNVSNIQYQWVDCATKQFITGATNQIYSPAFNGMYAVQLSKGTCMVQSPCASITAINIEYPNLVTANNDGKNDFLELPVQKENYTLEIYNRWGALIYKTNNYSQNWPEEPSSGIYYYTVYTDQATLYKSWLQVIR